MGLLLPRLSKDPRAAWIAAFFLAATLMALPWVAGHFGNAWVRVLAFACLYVMLALGLNIVVGFAGLLDLGYIAFYAVGAYMYALLALSLIHISEPTRLLSISYAVFCLKKKKKKKHKK